MNPDKFKEDCKKYVDVEFMRKDLLSMLFRNDVLAGLIRDGLDEPQVNRRSSIVEGYLKDKGLNNC